MKTKIKKILEQIFGIGTVNFFNLKKHELKIKIFLSSDKAKEKYIQKKFKKRVGYEIDFNKEPKTFNEKIQFRKLYDKNPLYSICADKYRVREYVKDKIGEEYLIPLLLVTDKLTEEQWDKLPNQFVAKANHNSGPVQIVKDKSKANKKEIIRELNNQLKLDYGVLSLENWYSDIPRKIIVEKYLDHEGDTLEDFKFSVFRDEKKIFVDNIIIRNKKNLHSRIFDENWEPQNFQMGTIKYEAKIKKPNKYEEMLEIVKKLGQDFDYARVDLYNINGIIYFGELTFAENSGFGEFNPSEYDYKFGNFWKQKKLKSN
ncbi:ATP-grasp fold amidoligase family protein [Fusobacterium sp. MFO224]|uniref:ATP-grasp fold amidoligase family protein n=1 Tax=Fusobacterium sp. MFO224 TaxID=3378070 RepID=UPI0038540F83